MLGALTGELSRSISDLEMAGEPGPYYMAFTVTDATETAGSRDAGRAGREPVVAGARVPLRRTRGRLRVRQLAVHRGRPRRRDGVDRRSSRSTTTSWRRGGWRG
ncbi:MAG: hypothetical protein MZV70_19590 [Desulfobacterales bacterium]|nr:hypothetical protein [Desulfobacterales bacterium]